MHSLLRQQAQRRRRWFVLLTMLLLLSFLLNLSVGQLSLSLNDWLSGLSPLQQQVLLELRLPRAWLALLLGAGLAVSGCVLQTLLHNPVADTGLIGVSSGASLFAVITLFVARRLEWLLPPWLLPVAAFAGALLITLALLGLARRGRLDNARLLLLGVAMGICASAITTWLLYFASDQSMREIMFWMMGSLAYGQTQPLWWWLPYLLVLFWLLGQSRQLALLQLGEYQAQLMGLNLRQVRQRLVLAVCVLSGMAVALAGAIGFIGLLVPHLMRQIGRDGPAFVLPASALGGGCLLLWADLLSRTLLPSGELPVGVLTASLGAPLFIYLLVCRDA